MDRFVSFDGVEIAYEDRSSSVGSGPSAEKTPVVLHHGFAADTNANWRRPKVFDALVATGRRVVSIDARGHGQSDKPHDPAAYDSPAMVSDLAALFDHLELDQVDLIGYSMGAFVALETATRDSRLRSLVLGGIGAGALPGQDRLGPPIDIDAVAVSAGGRHTQVVVAAELALARGDRGEVGPVKMPFGSRGGGARNGPREAGAALDEDVPDLLRGERGVDLLAHAVEALELEFPARSQCLDRGDRVGIVRGEGRINYVRGRQQLRRGPWDERPPPRCRPRRGYRQGASAAEAGRLLCLQHRLSRR